VFAGALSGSALTAGGVWNFVSSTRLWPWQRRESDALEAAGRAVSCPVAAEKSQPPPALTVLLHGLPPGG
jgi:hypothetical protein